MKKQTIRKFPHTIVGMLKDISSPEGKPEHFRKPKHSLLLLIKILLASIFRKKNLYRKFPIFVWLPKYNSAKLVSDLIAGVTLGLTTIPSVLGIANIAQIPPEYGLHSGFIGCFVYIFLGSTKFITCGPTVNIAIMTLSYAKDEPPEFSVLLCFLTGIVTTLMSFFKLGFIIEFISSPAISAFTSAAAISIAAAQTKGLLGINYSATGLIQEISGLIENLAEIKWKDAAVAASCLVVILILKEIVKICGLFGIVPVRVKNALWFVSTSRNVIVVVFATMIFALLGNPPAVSVVGNVPKGMPSFKAPPLEFSEDRNGTLVEFSLGSTLRDKTAVLIAIPLIAFMEHITAAKALAGTEKVDANQELLCIGLSNLLGCFFGSIPVTGALGRSSLNYASGAQSPLGGLVTGAIVILALVVLTPQFYFIPRAALNSIMVLNAIFIVDFRTVKSIWMSKTYLVSGLDIIPWSATFFVSLLVGLEYGILVGFGISCIFIFYQAARPGVEVCKCETRSGIEFLCVEIDSSIIFPTIDYIRYVVMKVSRTQKTSQALVLDCSNVHNSDYTAGKGLCDMIKVCNAEEQRLILYKVKENVRKIWIKVAHLRGLENHIIFCDDELELDKLLKNKQEKSHT